MEKKKIEDVKADKLRQIEELRQRKNNPSTVISSGVTKPAPLEKTLPKANIVPPMPPSTASNFATPNGFQNVQKKPIQNVLNIFQKKSETMPSTTPVQSPAITTSSITSSENSKIVYVSKDSPISQPEKLSPPEGKSEDVVRGTENMPISNAPQIEAPVPSKVLPAIESMSSSVNINTATIDTKLPSIQTSDVVTAPVTVEIPPKQEILVPVSEIQIPAPVSVETRIVSPPSVMPAVEEDFEEEYEIASRLDYSFCSFILNIFLISIFAGVQPTVTLLIRTQTQR